MLKHREGFMSLGFVVKVSFGVVGRNGKAKTAGRSKGFKVSFGVP